MKSSPTEFEAALVITSPAPQAVAAQIAGLSTVAGYRLQPREPQTIRDLHLDTPEGALISRLLALRLRMIDGVEWMTLKGPSRHTDWGGVERLEVEVPWSLDAAADVLGVLQRWNLAVPALTAHPGAAPLEVLERAGLRVIQDRETTRQLRAVVGGPEPNTPVLAELAVDAVTYRFRRPVHLHGVEIEAKSAGGSVILRAGVDALLAAHAPALRVWPYGKLRTGQVIQRLLDEGALDSLLTSDHMLTPAAYDEIERRLKG